MGSLTLKGHNSFQNLNNRKATQFCFQTFDLASITLDTLKLVEVSRRK